MVVLPLDAQPSKISPRHACDGGDDDDGRDDGRHGCDARCDAHYGARYGAHYAARRQARSHTSDHGDGGVSASLRIPPRTSARCS
jgi:hypothetical protein